MSFNVNVKDGTGAGRKRPLRDRPDAWVHPCVEGQQRELRGYWKRCPDCKTERP